MTSDAVAYCINNKLFNCLKEIKIKDSEALTISDHFQKKNIECTHAFYGGRNAGEFPSRQNVAFEGARDFCCYENFI